MLYINEKIRINQDSMNIIVEQLKETNGKNGKTAKWKVEGYYGKLEHALNSVADIIINETYEKVDTTTNELIGKIEELKNNLFIRVENENQF